MKFLMNLNYKLFNNMDIDTFFIGDILGFQKGELIGNCNEEVCVVLLGAYQF